LDRRVRHHRIGDILMLSYFKFYRRLRGGRWGRVTGWFFGYRWVRLSPEAEPLGAVIEQYRRRYCNCCVHQDYSVMPALCDATGSEIVTRTWHHEKRERVERQECSVKNRFNDCRDFSTSRGRDC
jgi:hypothetical protein